MSEIHKITYGFVTQRFDEQGRFLGQEFTAGDQCEYENVDQNIIRNIDADEAESIIKYIPFNMIQPGVFPDESSSYIQKS